MSQALDPVTQHHVDRPRTRSATSSPACSREETIERYIAESVDLLGGRPDQRVRARARASLRARAAEGTRPDGRDS